MPESDPIRIFITHEFSTSEEYARVFEYLESRDNFFYVNCSQPGSPPAGGQEAMQDELRDQISRAEVVIFPIGSVDENSALLRFQLTAAQAFDKPILVINAFGGTISISKDIMERAADMVDWNDRIITEALRRLARGGDSQAWDVVEFDMD